MSKSERTPKEIRGAIIGTLLGDSWISEGNRYGCEQSSYDLIKVKSDIISHYTKEPPNIIKRIGRKSIINGRVVNSSTTYTIRARHPRFKNWRKVFYFSGKKQVTTSVLKKLTPEGIAMWIMDDGYMDYKRSKCMRNLRLCTDSFSEMSIKNIIRYFKEEFEIDSKVFWHCREKGANKNPRISFNAKNTQKIIAIVHNYVLDSFLYKIDMHYLKKTVYSNRCSNNYREAYEIISQRKAGITPEDIV